MAWPPKYCSECGGRMAAPVGGDPAATCDACGTIHYWNAKPCAGALIERQGQVLLARRGVSPHAGMWDVVGGFVRPDESPEHAAVREALEETGLEVSLGELVGMYVDRYGDQPGSDYTLNIYFRARPVAGGVVAQSDVAELRWFSADDIPALLAFTHEREVLADWRRMPRLD